jgi:Arylsulfotransferase (ASST)
MPEGAPAESTAAGEFAGSPSVPRRQALRLGGSVAAGAALLTGCSRAPLNSLGSGAPGTGAGSKKTGAGTGGDPRPDDSTVWKFRSRPDLRPARAVIETNKGTSEPGVFLLDSHAGVGQQGPIVLDNAGELVWFKPLSSHATNLLRAFNLRVQTYRGEPVLTWWQGRVVHAHGDGHYVLANSRYEVIKRVYATDGLSGDLHDFLITDAGTALFTCYGTARADLRSLGGSADNLYYYGVVQEVDIATGKLLFHWRSDHHIPFSYSYAPMLTSSSIGWDQFHLNSVNVAPDGNLIISSRNTWTVYKVHRKTGEVMWRMGGKHSDFKMGRHTRFAWQHHVTPHASGIITIFDNEAGDYKVGKHSRGLVLEVDETTRRVPFVRQYNPPVHILSSALGSVQELPGGHVLVGWGEKPYFTEYTKDGKVVFSGHLSGHGTFDYRAFKSPWTGRPDGRPAIAADRSGSGMTVYASWNGDTRVQQWKVLGGSHQDSLAVVGEGTRRGFETSIKVSRATRYVAAAGYDGDGHELGRSPVHRV